MKITVMGTNEDIVFSLEKENNDLLYSKSNFWNQIAQRIEQIKSLFSGYVFTTYITKTIARFGIVCLISLPLDERIRRFGNTKLNNNLETVFCSWLFIWAVIMSILTYLRGKKVDKQYNALLSKLIDFRRHINTMEELYSSFIWEILQEVKSEKINEEHLINIKVIIENINTNYSSLTKVSNILNPSTYLESFDGSKKRNLFIDLMGKIKEETTQYIQTTKEKITEKIQLWLSIHQNKLQELEKTIESQENNTQNIDWKTALETEKIRLQSYIESINKLVK